MPSDVDLCNLALSHLGDEANVQALSAADGSVQAMHCRRFYPIARDSLLEMHDWNFASRRAVMAENETVSNNQWQYAYTAPAQMICARKVLDVNAVDDWSMNTADCFPPNFGYSVSSMAPIAGVNARQGLYTPQPFIRESLDTGEDVIFTNQANALLLYTLRISDSTKFSPLFVDTLGYFLASKLAGPILKGAEGRAVAKEMLQTAMGFLAKATTSDAQQRRTDIAPEVSWIANR